MLPADHIDNIGEARVIAASEAGRYPMFCHGPANNDASGIIFGMLLSDLKNNA